MRHTYECPMRWADLDMLGHVNNVTYVDYLQEARVDLLRTLLPARRDDLAEGAVVVRHEVTYVSPLLLGRRPVSIECWVTDVRAASFTLAYEVFHPRGHDSDGVEGGRRVYLRATTVLTPYVFADERPRRLSEAERESLHPYVEEPFADPTPRIGGVDRERATGYDLQVRFSDVDLYRHVNNVKYFEYLQESRIAMFAELLGGRGAADGTPPLRMVVAQTDVDYRRPILLRREPYAVRSELARLGTRSMTIESEIADGDDVLARARVTTVFFDPATGRSADPHPRLREQLSALVRPPA